jgi:hypothetical protein
MKIIVAVIIYDRFNNLKLWIDIWKQCITDNAELVIVHNYKNEDDKKKYKEYCDDNNIECVSRPNIGMDIGAMQDVFMQRLKGFNNSWDYLLWVTDDTIPINKNFIEQYIQKFKESNKVGVVALEISNDFKKHIRTSGFMIRKDCSLKIVFESNPVRTKNDCYLFEHLSKNSFLEQVNRMGLIAIDVSPKLKTAPLWDTEIRAYLNRWVEFDKNFEDIKRVKDKVIVICPIYNSYPQIISSLICQTHKNWILVLIHDGKASGSLKNIIGHYADSRIIFLESETRKGNWGHFYRQFGIDNIDNLVPDAEYVVITNADNYHVPTYLEKMMEGFITQDIVATYCSTMVHSYLSPQQVTYLEVGQQSSTELRWEDYTWGTNQCKLEFGRIDCAGIMVKKECAQKVGWNDIVTHSSDWTYISDIIKEYGEKRINKVNGCLLVHN